MIVLGSGMRLEEGVKEGARGGHEGSRKGAALLQMQRIVSTSQGITGKVGDIDGMCD